MEEHICKFCGSPQKFSKNKNKWYCGALCWMKNSQPQPETTPEPQNSSQNAFSGKNGINPSLVLMDEIKALNERLDNMGEFFAKMDKKIDNLIELAQG